MTSDVMSNTKVFVVIYDINLLILVCVIYIVTSQCPQYNNNQYFWQFDVPSACSKAVKQWKVLFHVKYLAQMEKKTSLFTWVIFLKLLST